MEFPEGKLLTIAGVEVEFPCKPYPQQISIMNKLIMSFKNRQNCLIESPTGTGKSLALLCGALSWLKNEKRSYMEALKAELNAAMTAGSEKPVVQQDVQQTTVLGNLKVQVEELITIDDDDSQDFVVQTRKKRKSTSVTSSSKAPSISPSTSSVVAEQPAINQETSASAVNDKRPRQPVIFYGTRTHKQVSQIVRELNKTAYRSMRMAILASREKSCVNRSALHAPSGVNEECRRLNDEEGCLYSRSLQRDRAKASRYPTLFSSGEIEPYDLEDLKELCVSTTDFCPYFWTIDMAARADIVFCPYQYILDPMIRSALDIKLNEAVVILDEAHNIESICREAIDFQATLEELDTIVLNIIDVRRLCGEHWRHRSTEVSASLDALSNQLAEASTLVHNLISFIQRSALGADESQMPQKVERGCVWAGAELRALFVNIGVDADQLKRVREVLEFVSKVQKESPDSDRYLPALSAASRTRLATLGSILWYLFRNEARDIDSFKAVLTSVAAKSNVQREISEEGWHSKRQSHGTGFTWKFHIMCLNPSVALIDLKESIRSLVVASGTLSPLISFESELDFVFHHKCEASHVISNDQVWVGCFSRGPTNQELTGNFQESSRYTYQDEVGAVVLRVCQIVPSGVLCFFPSYSMLKRLTERWEFTGLMERFRTRKVVISEGDCRTQKEFDTAMMRFYEAAAGVSGLESVDGALLFAVCRGKVSEGQDFSDQSARAVITIGIPFPNLKGIDVLLKQQYNDKVLASGKRVLSGSQWYKIQAFRALNQALGRCIRHKLDWGALIIVDSRFVHEQYRNSLSRWLRQDMKVWSDFEKGISSLEEFNKTQKQSEVLREHEANFEFADDPAEQPPFSKKPPLPFRPRSRQQNTVSTVDIEDEDIVSHPSSKMSKRLPRWFFGKSRDEASKRFGRGRYNQRPPKRQGSAIDVLNVAGTSVTGVSSTNTSDGVSAPGSDQLPKSNFDNRSTDQVLECGESSCCKSSISHCDNPSISFKQLEVENYDRLVSESGKSADVLPITISDTNDIIILSGDSDDLLSVATNEDKRPLSAMEITPPVPQQRTGVTTKLQPEVNNESKLPEVNNESKLDRVVDASIPEVDADDWACMDYDSDFEIPTESKVVSGASKYFSGDRSSLGGCSKVVDAGRSLSVVAPSMDELEFSYATEAIDLSGSDRSASPDMF